MAISIICDNKKCFKQTEAQFDPETEEILCLECNKPIKNVTVFMKRQLQFSGQVVKQNTKKSFSVKCPSCKKQDTPKINTQKELICSFCEKSLEKSLSKPYISMVKEFVSKAL